MASLAVKLPITKNTADGFEMIKDFQTLIVMEPSFGVGVQKYLFENFSQKTFSDIEAKIIEQVQIYMPVITIREVNFAEDIANTNKLYINIQYSIPTLNVQDLIEFTI